jgi:hypothetical protein
MGPRAPEDVGNVVIGTVEFVSYCGASASYRIVAADGSALMVTRPLVASSARLRDGDRVATWWAPDRGFIIA